jgi:apolipoprotein N-acyltransferase
MPGGADADGTAAGATAPHRSSAAMRIGGHDALARAAAAVASGGLVHAAVGTGTPRLVAAVAAMVALAWAIRGLGPPRAAALGLLAGVVGCGAMLAFVLRGVELAGLSVAHGLGALALATLLHAGRFALAAALASLAARRMGAGLALAAGWVAAELVDPAPLPWSLGAATLELPAAAAIAAQAGTGAAAALIPCLTGGLVVDALADRRRSAGAAAVALVLLALVGGVHGARLEAASEAGRTVRLAAVHGARVRSAADAPPVVERRAAERAVAAGAELVVLPEAALRVGDGAAMRDAAEAVFGDLRAAVAVGVVAAPHGANAVVILDRGGASVAANDKLRPFPGGEDRSGPWAWLGAPAGALRAAGARSVVAVSTATGPLRIATAICWDDLFTVPGAGDADVIVVVVNDGWFEGTDAGEAHLLQARLRAAVAARPMVRATNLGGTAIVDAEGRVVARAAPGDDLAMADLRLPR